MKTTTHPIEITLNRILGDSRPTVRKLTCGAANDCCHPVAYLDNKGYVYCENHGQRRKSIRPCRKLTAGEIGKLTRGETFNYSKARK